MATYDLHQFKDQEGNIYNFTDDDARATADAASDNAEATRRTANGIGLTSSNYVPLGRNLATVFASEIGSTDPITWLKNRAASGNFKGLQIGDYLTVVLNNTAHTSMNYQIAGFDQYYGVGDTINGHMITLVPASTYPDAVKFNEAGGNNGNADETSPWLASDLYDWMNETFYGFLPAAWQNALKNIRVYNPIRYSASGTLTDDNGGKWISLGKVWAPSEIEVWGSVRLGTPHNGETLMANTDRQIPIFANGRTPIRSRLTWWERCAASGSSANVCGCGHYGRSSYYSASYDAIRALPCFHIG